MTEIEVSTPLFLNRNIVRYRLVKLFLPSWRISLFLATPHHGAFWVKTRKTLCQLRDFGHLEKKNSIKTTSTEDQIVFVAEGDSCVVSGGSGVLDNHSVYLSQIVEVSTLWGRGLFLFGVLNQTWLPLIVLMTLAHQWTVLKTVNNTSAVNFLRQFHTRKVFLETFFSRP